MPGEDVPGDSGLFGGSNIDPSLSCSIEIDQNADLADLNIRSDLKTYCSVNSNGWSFRFFLNDTESVSTNKANVVRASRTKRD